MLPYLSRVESKSAVETATITCNEIGMSNRWLKKQGLVSVKELWANIHNPAVYMDRAVRAGLLCGARAGEEQPPATRLN